VSLGTLAARIRGICFRRPPLAHHRLPADEDPRSALLSTHGAAGPTSFGKTVRIVRGIFVLKRADPSRLSCSSETQLNRRIRDFHLERTPGIGRNHHKFHAVGSLSQNFWRTACNDAALGWKGTNFLEKGLFRGAAGKAAGTCCMRALGPFGTFVALPARPVARPFRNGGRGATLTLGGRSLSRYAAFLFLEEFPGRHGYDAGIESPRSSGLFITLRTRDALAAAGPWQITRGWLAVLPP